MNTETTHTAREGFERRLEDFRAILALDREGDEQAELLPATFDRLVALGMGEGSSAGELAAGYYYGAHVLWAGDVGREPGRDELHVSRVELLLAGGGPTHVLTWDERGPGWGEYFDSWASPDCYQLTNDEDETVAQFLAAFVCELEA